METSAENNNGPPEGSPRDPTEVALDAATSVLGTIMSVLAGRRLLKRGIWNEVLRDKLMAEALSDEQLEKLAADAFETAVLRLVEVGYPGCSAHTCSSANMEEW